MKKIIENKNDVILNTEKDVENVEINNENNENSKNNENNSESKSAKEKGKLQIRKARLIPRLWILWRKFKKAKKITKKIARDPNMYSEEYRYNFMKKFSRTILKLLNIKIDVFGIENWLDRGIVLAPNHQSNLDPLILLAINDFSKQQPIGFVAKKELWESKSTKNFMNLIDNLSLDRKSPRSALKVMKEAKELINEYKRTIGLFPEGTRSAGQEIGEFLGASMKVAQMAYCPVVPVTIIDSYLTYKKDRPKKLTVKVIFGKPIMPEKHVSIKTEMLTNNVKKEVVKNMEKYININPREKKLVPKSINKKDRCIFY